MSKKSVKNSPNFQWIPPDPNDSDFEIPAINASLTKGMRNKIRTEIAPDDVATRKDARQFRRALAQDLQNEEGQCHSMSWNYHENEFVIARCDRTVCPVKSDESYDYRNLFVIPRGSPLLILSIRKAKDTALVCLYNGIIVHIHPRDVICHMEDIDE